ncbi:H(+)/Cl(-) exchange transporter ClcA [Apilactobacillus kunkeei]|uniref:ClC family H(+)/Cl(-) exchange transporter n=1 Tax=Apilactobacillus kunkeei TaxID=148814 RepID=UPI001CDB8054|nr:ClC family H(+)/Cl(-) exchange transporter [Apilactobacillus kunkeei]CAI2643448.1 H(+)/Cl(-) exchange transporter ClcA [Apilactobacillus kunkeei]CAI2645512.1 H(+)/Cl(-) exchange transporter ClcA [Apilactobacillus kunkeei]
MQSDNLRRFKSVLYGLLIGLAVGMVVSLFRVSIEGLSDQFLKLANLARTNFFVLIILIILNLLIAFFVYYLVKRDKNIKGSGIPQVEGQLNGELDYSWFSVLSKKFIGGVLAISSGIFLGREGPSIQLGAATAQGLADTFKQTKQARKTIISGGAAAGLAAAFNAPIASTLFVLEEIYHNFSTSVWLTSLSAAISANFVSTAVFGKVPVLHMSYSHVIPLHIYPYLIGLGIVIGIGGLIYEYATLHVNDWYEKLDWIPNIVWVLIPFILVIPFEMYLPTIVGGGSTMVLTIAKAAPTITVLLWFLLIRFVMSILSYSTGLPGGIFLPMLSLGALIGAIYSEVLIQLGVLPQSYFVNFIIISMSGFFACVGKAPFTAILLITEMVGSLQNLMSLAFVTLVAYEVTDLLGGSPIYNEMLQNMLSPQKLSTSGQLTNLYFSVQLGSDMDGKAVKSINLPDGCLISSIKRNEQYIIPDGDTILRAGDNIEISTNYDNRGYIYTHVEKLTLDN